MIEIKWYARGGQGGFTASRLAGLAGAGAERYAQAFPSFGPERRGAPVYAFTRIDDKPIRNHSQIYSCDYAIVLDDTLLETLDVTQGLKPGGKLYINTARTPLECGIPAEIETRCFDASSLALEVLGADITNTAMLALFCADTGLCSLEALQEAVREGMSGKLAEKNLPLVERVYAGYEAQEKKSAAPQQAKEAAAAEPPQGKPPITKVKMPESFEEMPFGPSSPAGVLTEGNAGWRVRYPKVDAQRCVRCMLCWTFCPDGVIDKEIRIDLRFCKGCGICARECPRDAITMHREGGE